MTEPWAAFGPVDGVPGLPAPLVALVARAEAREDAADRRLVEDRQAEREDRAEARLHHWMVGRAQQLALEGRPFNLNDPASLVMSVEEQADRVFAAEDRAAARSEFRAKVDAGLVHLLNIPASEMAPSRPDPSPDQEQLADGWLDRQHQRTEHAGIVARIRRGLRGRTT